MAADPDQQQDAISNAQRLIQQGDFAGADAALDAVLEGSPKLREALYMKAVCARYMAKPALAADWLAKLRGSDPEYGRGYQEEGHLHLQEGRVAEALLAYRRACQFNPSLTASWEKQFEIFRQSGNAAEASRVAGQLQWLKGLPREVLAAMNHLHEGRLLKAEEFCRAFLQANPKHVAAMRVLADIASRLSIHEDAAFLLESAVVFEPDNVQARLDYAQVLRKQQRYEASLEQSQKLHDRNPEDPIFKTNLAIDSMYNNRFEDAFALFDAVLEKMPGDPATLVSRGHALKTFGRQEDAVASYRSAYASVPEFGDAWFGLANLKTYKFTDDEVALLRRLEASDQLTFTARVQINFALAEALEDRAAYEEAFRHFDKGNALKRAQSRYDADQMTAEITAQQTICTKALFNAKSGMGCLAPDPIFIVGLPRAGSTLLEQILASHSQIDGTLELPNILAMAHRLRRKKEIEAESHYPQVLHELDADKLQSLGEKYIADTRMHRQDAPFFIDKMPNNFRHIGLIKLILPNAKIIDARREPMAGCFSGFKQLFAEGQEFTYGLEQIGRYYHDYVHLMRHWDEVLPGAVLRVQYEDVVADPETLVRRMLDYLGLPFEEACLAFHTSKRVVRTASSEQVRQPINTKGLEAWKPFEPWLDPLKTALGDALTGYRD